MLRLAWGCLVIAACGCEDEARPATPEEAVTRPACEGGVFGVAAYDALYSRTIAGVPTLVSTDVEAVIRDRAELEPLLAAAARESPTALSVASRVALQNDAWGFLQRLLARPLSETSVEALVRSTRRLVTRLAATSAELDALSGDAEIARALPRADGFREVDSDMPRLQHEMLFGLRRLFRVYESEEWIALAGQLFAIDDQGAVHLTSIVGEIEMLRRDADELPIAARVLALDRRRLRCGEPSLVELTEVQHVPDLGANAHLLELPAPEPLATMPCARCHDDGHEMSLPNDVTDPSDRHRRITEAARDLARENGVGR